MPPGARPERARPSRGCLPANGIGHPDTRRAIDCPRLYLRTRTSPGRRRPIPDLADRPPPGALLHVPMADSASAPGTPRGCVPRVNHGWEWLPADHQEKYPNPRGPRRTTWCEPVRDPCPVQDPDRSTCAILPALWSLARTAYRRPTRNETHPAGRQWEPPAGCLLQPAHASIWITPVCNTTAVRPREGVRRTAQSDRRVRAAAASLSLEWRQ